MYNQETGDPIGNPMEYIRDGLQFGKLSGGQQHLIYILQLGVVQLCFGEFPQRYNVDASEVLRENPVFRNEKKHEIRIPQKNQPGFDTGK